MYVTFSGTVSFFWVPITFIHSETEGQRWVTPSLPQVLCVRPPRILVRLSWTADLHLSYCGLSRPRTRLIWNWRELKLLLLNVPFPSDVISQKTTLLSAPGSFNDMHSSDAHNCLQAGQVAPPKARCKTSTELSSLKKDSSKNQIRPGTTAANYKTYYLAEIQAVCEEAGARSCFRFVSFLTICSQNPSWCL